MAMLEQSGSVSEVLNPFVTTRNLNRDGDPRDAAIGRLRPLFPPPLGV
jgi:hypothetical protein